MSFLEAVPPDRAGGYAYLNTCLTTDARAGVPIATLAEHGTLAVTIARFATSFAAGTDRRAIGSMWWQYYVSLLLPPAVALRLRGLSIDTDATATAAIIGADGLATGFAVRCVAAEDDHEAWSGRCLADLCEPLVSTLRACTGVSRRTLWASAASRLDDLKLGLTDIDPGAACRVDALLRAPVIGRGPNPLFGLVRYGGPCVCCLRDRLPGYTTCANCPTGGTRAASALGLSAMTAELEKTRSLR